MESIPQLIDAIYRERILRARRTPPEQKLMAGAELFDYACDITRSGIRNQHPKADDAQVEAILAQRIALSDRLGDP